MVIAKYTQIIGVSLSEPHTSESNGHQSVEFSYIAVVINRTFTSGLLIH